jgi:two-component system response regulator NreC
MKTRLLLVDDHAVVRTGLRMLLEGEEEIEIVGEAETASDALNLISQVKPDVILMDIGLPDMSGIDATRRIRQLAPDSAVLALTIHEDEEYFFQMLDAGAAGYVPKRAAPEELLTAIRVTAQTLDGLTPRENEVLTLLADGASNAEIAQQLSISPKTVARHRENIMGKLNLHTRTELVKYAIRKGIIQP